MVISISNFKFKLLLLACFKCWSCKLYLFMFFLSSSSSVVIIYVIYVIFKRKSYKAFRVNQSVEFSALLLISYIVIYVASF